MGIFDGALLVSDYDDTIHYTSEAMAAGKPVPPVNPRNLTAIRHWIAEGGVFAVATGRALAAFLNQGRAIPANAPCIVDNGGAIYDLRSGRYLLQNLLPQGTAARIALVAEAFPALSLELYHPQGQPQVLRPADWDWQHAKMAGMGLDIIDRVDAATVPEPLSKVLFVGDHGDLEAARRFMLDRGWGEWYELIYSSARLLEMTAKGADKGGMALWLKEMCGCTRLYCAGDHANDLPMLRAADRGFAPANAIDEVRSSGVTVVCHCRDGAIADIVALLEAEPAK